MITYAQNFEDVMLERAFKDVQEGFYVDVGAWHPTADSVTQAFYSRGWRGINVEPNPDSFRLFPEARPRDINLQIGLSSASGIGSLTAPKDLSGCSAFGLAPSGLDSETYSVPLKPLAEILSEHAPNVIHFLKIDVEGFERAVIEGNDWQRFHPQVLVIEATKPNSSIPNHEQWEGLIKDAHYIFAWFDGLNRFYVAQESRVLLVSPLG